jgi:hypothetical protein
MGPDWCTAVVGLHDFFTRWFAGHVPNDRDEFWPVAGALAEDFTIVSPHGHEHDRAATLAMLESAHGSGTGGPHISIAQCRVLHAREGSAVVRYVEVQNFDDGRRTERLSTALLEADPKAPDGVLWHSVHETWTAESS